MSTAGIELPTVPLADVTAQAVAIANERYRKLTDAHDGIVAGYRDGFYGDFEDFDAERSVEWCLAYWLGRDLGSAEARRHIEDYAAFIRATQRKRLFT
jgi:hypothetical protein